MNKNKRFVIVLSIITLIGAIIRIISCYWGYPLQLHPDEHTIVDNVIDMLSRHSWEAFVYNRPDQFEIKCNAILFSIISWIKFHAPAYETFKDYTMLYYLIARGFTSIFGIALIPLSALVVGKIVEGIEINKKWIQYAVAILIAFSSIFVQHSAYATPDIPLTFFVVLFSYFFMEYLEKGELKDFIICSIIIGISVTIKYPAMILSILLAFMVIYRECLYTKKYLNILKYAIISIFIILFVMFIIAPNLFTDLSNVIKIIKQEARPTHLGADNLGFFGNLSYYLITIIENLGYISIIPFILGIVAIFKNIKNVKNLVFLIGLIYWICMSVLSLHWLRWGIPIYAFYILLVSIGIGYIIALLGTTSKNIKIASYVGLFLNIILLLNVFLSGICVTKSNTLPSATYLSQSFFEENKINKEDVLYEGYTIFASDKANPRVPKLFEFLDGKIKPVNKYLSKKYFIMSNSFRDRFFGEPKRYFYEISLYNAINSNYELVYKLEADGNYSQKPFAFYNILYSIKYLFSKKHSLGGVISVYKLK